MANVDTIDVVGPTSLSELTAMVAGIAGTTPRGSEDASAAVTLGPGIVAQVYYDPVPGEEYPYFVGVYESNMAEVSVSERLAASRRLYDALIERTDWGLRYASDDAADFPIARRSRVARGDQRHVSSR